MDKQKPKLSKKAREKVIVLFGIQCAIGGSFCTLIMLDIGSVLEVNPLWILATALLSVGAGLLGIFVVSRDRKAQAATPS